MSNIVIIVHKRLVIALHTQYSFFLMFYSVIIINYSFIVEYYFHIYHYLCLNIVCVDNTDSTNKKKKIDSASIF